MVVKSKFRPWVGVIAGLFILLTVVLLLGVGMLMTGEEFSFFGLLAASGVGVFFWVWVFFGELRTKAVKVSMDVIALRRLPTQASGQKRSSVYLSLMDLRLPSWNQNTKVMSTCISWLMEKRS